MKKYEKDINGITLISLIITIIVLLIISSITIYSGKNIIKDSKFNTFSTELKIMQTNINDIYDKYKSGETVNGFQGEDILTSLGKEIASDSEVSAQATKVFTSEESGITDQTGYRFFDAQTLADINIEGIEQEFFVNISKRSVISYQGFEYDKTTYYTVDQLNNNLYNVEYEENENKPTFDVSVEAVSDEKWKVTISNIQYNGYINKWQIKYQMEGQDYWNTSEEESFVVTGEGMYNIYIGNGNILSEIKKKAIGVAEPQPETGGTNFTRTAGTTEIVFLKGTSYTESDKANEPLVDINTMIPIKYNGTNWVVTTTSDPDWYNYDTEERKWANVMLSDGTYKAGIVQAGQVVQESELGSMFVWIPRYAYKIVYFNNEDDKKAYIESERTDTSKIVGYSDARGIVDTNDKVPSDITEEQITSIAIGDNYRPHPVFEKDVIQGGWGEKTTGIWVGKFETTETTSTNGTNMILPNKKSQNYLLDVSAMFSKAQEIGTSLNMTLDSHMMKNSEWGATAYFAESKYGRNGTEISVNQCNNYITGAGRGIDGTDPIYNSTYSSSTITKEQRYNGNIGMLSSTTGNIYGIYDISGGAWEYVMGFYGTDENTPVLGSTGFSTAPEGKYYNLYINKTLSNITIGDAVFETKSWNNVIAEFVTISTPIFGRGGSCNFASTAGPFFCDDNSGLRL